MRTIGSADEARRLALATGAELSVEGQTFNSQRTQLREVAAARPAPEPPAPAPAPAPPDTYTRAEVDALLAKQAAKHAEQLARVLASLKSSAPAAPVSPAQWDFDIVENAEGAIVKVVARATS